MVTLELKKHARRNVNNKTLVYIKIYATLFDLSKRPHIYVLRKKCFTGTCVAGRRSPEWTSFWSVDVKLTGGWWRCNSDRVINIFFWWGSRMVGRSTMISTRVDGLAGILFSRTISSCHASSLFLLSNAFAYR